MAPVRLDRGSVIMSVNIPFADQLRAYVADILPFVVSAPLKLLVDGELDCSLTLAWANLWNG